MTPELDLTAFNALFNTYQQRFVRFAGSYVYDYAVAEDLVMESFEVAWAHREVLSVETFPAYTMTVIKNKCLNHLRAQKIRTRAGETITAHQGRVLDLRISTLQACEPDELFGEEAQRLVNEALATLPERTREIFVRSRFQNQSYKQIAEQMETTVKSVEFEISKTMKVLRVALKDYLALLILLNIS
ncbi:MAG: RNA polymerase sigma-70 factor [Alistipes sp.]